MNNIIFKGLQIEHICKPTLKHSYINITTDSKIILKTPNVSKDFINNILIHKEAWIRKKLLQISKKQLISINIGDEILLYGEIISIGSPELSTLRESLLEVKTHDQELRIQKYQQFYKNEAKEYLTKKLNYFANIMQVQYSEVKYRKMKTRWGSCSSKKRITLNTELIKVKKNLIDYVLVHELAHLVYMNHSKQFHKYVEKFLPNAQILRAELKSIYLEK